MSRCYSISDIVPWPLSHCFEFLWTSLQKRNQFSECQQSALNSVSLFSSQHSTVNRLNMFVRINGSFSAFSAARRDRRSEYIKPALLKRRSLGMLVAGGHQSLCWQPEPTWLLLNEDASWNKQSVIGWLFGADNRPKHYRCTSSIYLHSWPRT